MIDLHKIYFVLRDELPVKVFLDKTEAHEWAEDVYGSRSDGICVAGVRVHAARYELV